MSKQRCLLIVTLLFCGFLFAQIHVQSEFLVILNEAKTGWQSSSIVNANVDISKQLSFEFQSRFAASDSIWGDYTQRNYLNNLTTLGFHNSNLKVNAGYHNTFYGSDLEQTLYPTWNPGGYYTRHAQHQSHINFQADAKSLQTEAYAIHKHLRAVPTEYVYDFNTDTMIPNIMPERGFDDIYYGARLELHPHPYLRMHYFADLKQANFDEGDTYRINSLGMGLSSKYMLTFNSWLSGSFVFNNRISENLPPESAKQYQSQIRYQHNLGTSLGAFVSYINNSCSDDQFEQFYLVSSLVRAHIKYNFNYDNSQASYLLFGGKYSPEHEANAAFVEANAKVYKRFYAFAAYKNLSIINRDQPANLYQGKLSYYFSPVSECFIQYSGNDVTLNKSSLHHLGLGTSIYF